MKFSRLSLILFCLVFGIAACNLPTAQGSGPAAPQNGQPNNGSDPQAATAQAATAIQQALEATMTAMATPIPPTPSFTDTPAPTNTPSIPLLSVSTATNCRTGPGTAYDILGGIAPGQQAEVVGRDATGNYWIVRLPSSPTVICWAWGQYATVTGNTAALPIFDPPPTPTPAPGFTVSYIGMASCAGQYAFRFQVSNTGSITWEAVRIFVTDNTTAATFTHQQDFFRDYPSCILGDMNQDLMPGEAGNVANVNPGQLGYDPTGHSISATITVCSANGMGGTCLSQTLNFTP